MNRHGLSRRLGALALLATLGLVPLPAAQAKAPPRAAAAALPQPVWMHDQLQREPDPAVRFGRLPNGLRYALQHNETPKDGVAMRMRIAAGSLQERDDEQGLAHFLEHMAFRGSQRVPDGEVVHMLQRQGLNFGADTNAFTAQDQTVYFFNFPKADASALDTGLLLLREIGQHLTLDAKLIEQEKGVLLSEERVRDVPPLRSLMADLNNSLAGTRVAQRWPIGKVASIQGATAGRLRRYYQANYRPGNATLIVVGNIDVAAVEQQIRERFADWQAAARPDALDLGVAKPAQPAAEFVAEGAPDSLSLSWLLPPDLREPTLAVERERLLAQLGLAVLNTRLADRTLKPGSPFVGAGAHLDRSVFGVAGMAKLGVAAPPEQWRGALDAATEELRQLLAQGVQTADLKRVLPLVRSSLQAQVAQAPTRQHAAIADALLNAAAKDEVYNSATQVLALAEPMLASVQPDEVSAALRKAFGAGAPVVFRSAKAGAVGAPALAQQLARALSRPLQAQAAVAVASWPYIDFGAPSAVSSQTTDAELGTTTVLFANGTRLVVKPTTQEKDKVGVQVLLGQGQSGIAKDRTHALWAMGFFTLGGTGQRSLAEFLQWQQSSGKLVGVNLRVEPHALVLANDTRPADLLAQLQVLAAFARDPGFRPELGEKLKAVVPMAISQTEANAGAVFMRELGRVLSHGERRLPNIPSSADVAATQPEDLPAMLREGLASAADVVIVGDVSVADAIAATQASFAAGPARARPAFVPLTVTPTADGGPPHLVTHGGRADQAFLGLVWPMPDFWANPALARTGSVAAAIVQARLIDTVREKLGITYSPSASGGGSLDVPGQGSFQVHIETPTEKFEAFRSLLQAQLRELAERPVGADELQRAKQPLIERSLKAPERNGHWAYWLPRVLADARMKAAMLGETAALQAITAEQVQAYFRSQILTRQPVEVVAKAAPTAAKAQP